MLELTFGEQVKIVLRRKGMTIKELAELIEARTGKKMSRQNLTQRLSRDNFQEQDMRMIAGILECPLHLSILEESISSQPVQAEAAEVRPVERAEEPAEDNERDITIGELLDIHQELDEIARSNEEAQEAAVQMQDEETESVEYPHIQEDIVEMEAAEDLGTADTEMIDIETTDTEEEYTVEELLAEVEALEAEAKEKRRAQEEVREEKPHGWRAYLQRHRKTEAARELAEESLEAVAEPQGILVENTGEPQDISAESAEEPQDFGDMEAMPGEESAEENLGEYNPYTGKEYETNSVRMHPKRIGYVQVYDRGEHKWTDMTEWAFLGYQERKKALLGKDYEEPIYLD